MKRATIGIPTAALMIDERVTGFIPVSYQRWTGHPHKRPPPVRVEQGDIQALDATIDALEWKARDRALTNAESVGLEAAIRRRDKLVARSAR